MPPNKGNKHFLAIDLGASSGRGVVGTFDGARLTLREIHRFENRPAKRKSGQHWDSKRLFENVKKCLIRARERGFELGGVGIDTWGVDYGLLSAFGELLETPRHYRDLRTAGVMEEVGKLIGRERIYEKTGIAFLPFNTLYQLIAEKRAGGLDDARALAFMPDLLNYWLTGVWQTERTIASTSQFFDPVANTWANDILKDLGLPSWIMPEVKEPGTVIGKLRRTIATETRCEKTVVIAPASHDTGSAVVAVPGVGNDWAYISSGTWSLVGREIASPICTSAAMDANFTNECGLEKTIRFQKNVTGLWILQECQRVWASESRNYEHGQLAALAESTEELRSFIDPDDPAFAEFGEMPKRVQEFCERTKQPVPVSHGAIARCVIEGLALKCRVVLEQLERLTGKVSTIHMVGGGVHNALLCQYTANAMERPLIAGPVEATAIGNIMAQVLAMDGVKSLREIRGVVAASFSPLRYEPVRGDVWVEAIKRYRALLRV